MVRRESLAAVAALLFATAATPPLPQSDGQIHEGVASCASTVCHGRVNADTAGPVNLNEYRVWLRQDYHSRAYRTLLTEQSRDIADKLGLGAAHTADLCLDCHADNVDPSARGPRFQLEDGVGCEACHGGAGEWLRSHAEAGTSHADNIARGLYPTEDIGARAGLCLSCHLGTEDKFATHRIMGAGHPRLAFDLETFTVNQPAHFEVDADYIQRKGGRDAIATWTSGLAAASAQLLDILASERFAGEGPFPELAFYHCHACHHGMEALRWQHDQRAPALTPGSVRLNDGPLLVLGSLLQVIDRDAAGTLKTHLADLHRAAVGMPGRLPERAARTARLLSDLVEVLARRRYDRSLQQQLRRRLLEASAAGDFNYYTAAELAFLGVETLSLELGDAESLQPALDALYEALGDETRYFPGQFAVQANRLLEAL